MKEDELRDALRNTIAASSPPPPMSTTHAIAAGRRARVRRFAAWTGAGSATAVAVIAVVGIVFAGAGPAPGVAQPAGPGPVTTPPAQLSSSGGTKEPWPNGPDGKPQEDRTARAGTRLDQGVRLLDEIVAVVPAGYTAPENPATRAPNETPLRDHQAQFEDRVNGIEVWSYLSSAAVAQGERTGRLLVEVHTAGNQLSDDLCALAQTFWGMKGQCQVVTTGNLQVGVVVRPDGDDRFDQWAAYRHPDGVVVFVAQSRKFSDRLPSLTNLPFTVHQLAALATNERFHLH